MNIKNIKLPAYSKNMLIKKYPNKLSRMEKVEIAEKFFEIYKTKLESLIAKNQKKTFKEINRMTLISLVDLKTNKDGEYFKYIKEMDIIKIDKTIENYFLNLLEGIKINDNILLIRSEGKLGIFFLK